MIVENTIILGDCLEVMKEIPDNSVDMVLCDLPYGTTQNKWDSVIPFSTLWENYNRVTKSNAPIVLTGTQPFSSTLVCSNIGAFRYEWVWVKSKITGVLNAKRMPVRKHEQVLVFYRSQPTYNMQGTLPGKLHTRQGSSSSNYGHRSAEAYVQTCTNVPRDVLEIASEGNTIHPTQKPEALWKYLIQTYTNPGDLVLDNCSGSGTTAVACKATGRRFICIEKDPVYWRKSCERIGQVIA